jgi:hypothetical protein
MSALREFLKRNQITEANPLPLVHTTEAYFLKKIVATNKITVQPCNVFAGERLSYFFVGRPAYKKELNAEAEYWQLPVCFVFEFFVDGVRRIFPFDSGAFKSFPDYIGMMDIKEFEVGSDSRAPHKIIGTFFTSSQNYYRLNPRDQLQFESTFGVELLDEEIKALHKLIQAKGKKFDDRRFAIEMSFDHDVSLLDKKPLAIIIPEVYLTDESFFLSLLDIGAEIITYPIYPLRKNYFQHPICTGDGRISGYL